MFTYSILKIGFCGCPFHKWDKIHQKMRRFVPLFQNCYNLLNVIKKKVEGDCELSSVLGKNYEFSNKDEQK